MSVSGTSGSSSTQYTDPSQWLQFSGLASGLDTKTLIDKLMQLNAIPMTNIQNKMALLNKQNAAIQNIGTLANTLFTSVNTLNTDLQGGFTPLAATSSTTSVLTASATSSAQPGSYSVNVIGLATNATLSSGTAGSAARITASLAASNTLASLNPASGTAFTTGTFTVGGRTITINSTSATMQDVMDAINGVIGAGGSSGDGFITVNAGTGTSGVTASLSGGSLVLNSGGGAVTMGKGSDTSNFISSSGLNTAPLVGGNYTSASIKSTSINNTLSADTFGGGAVAGSGTFTINGTSFSYNSGTDTLGTIIGAINSANIGVTATYNAYNDSMTLTHTGAGAITVNDTSGNLASLLKLTAGAVSTAGANASISVNGTTYSSASNTFTNVATGLTFTAVAAGSSTVSVAADTTKITNDANTFVTNFNAVIDAINAATAVGAIANSSFSNGTGSTTAPSSTSSSSSTTPGQPGVLPGNFNLGQIESYLYQYVSTYVPGLAQYSSMADVGFSINSGSTTDPSQPVHLTLDTSKFQQALTTNFNNVSQVFTKTSGGSPVGAGVQLQQYLLNQTGLTGYFFSQNQSTLTQDKNYNDQIAQWQTLLQEERKTMQNQFTAMEIAVAQLKNQQSSLGALTYSGGSSTGG